MKQTAYQFLIWCSGSNPDVLAKCPRSEHIKHAGYGALILIPAVLALFTMTYAISTFTEHWYMYVPAGMCWAVIIFFADRFLISSFRKANNLRMPGTTPRSIEVKNLLHDFFSFAFLSRFVLAAFIGVGIAHPFTLLYFHKDIEQVMAANKVLAEQTIRNDHDLKANELKETIASKEGDVECLRKLLIYEQSDVKISTDCGSTSGIPGYQKRAATINQQLAQTEKELNVLYQRDSSNKTTAELLKQAALVKYDNTFSNGYIARENALVQLENMPGSNARTVKYFLIVFLVLIDTLAVSWKAFAKRGPYDDYQHVLEDDVTVETQLHLMENQQTLERKAPGVWKATL
ncbi:MAG TPA: DUF4407 domain-containing protein [Chitinophagales bacterium]|nr:DUF4407 domain-containing protein [Chitinophagales bacterium]